ncbi:MAG: porin family protein [Spirosomataceae bacterium]|jgi:hypothetical protein
MKKAILILAAICFSNLAMAQFTLGIKGGINFSNMVTDAGSFSQNIKESKDTKTGYSFGVYSRIGKKLYLQPEVLFATKGGKVDFVPVGGGSPISVDIKTNNIDIPVLIGYKLFNRIRINAGPVASIKISEDQKFLDELKKVTNDVDAAFEKATFGYQAGVGIKLLGFEIDLRNEGSLSSISSDKFSDPKFSQRLNGWQLTIGHKIL